jgi:SAM-dependent methyltransferase
MTAASPTPPYTFKPSPYSSHTLMLRFLPEKGGARRVLDLGCTGGYLSSILVERGFQVVGIDLPGSGRGDFPAGGRFLAADLDAGLPELSSRFDFVLCGDVLEHLKNPLRLLLQIRSALAPGGVLVASLPNSGHFYFRLNVLAGRFPAQDRGLFDRTHLHFYTWSGWLGLFSRAGFAFSHVCPTATPFGLALPQLGDTAGLLESASYRMARVWSTLFAYQFVVVAQPVALEGEQQ